MAGSSVPVTFRRPDTILTARDRDGMSVECWRGLGCGRGNFSYSGDAASPLSNAARAAKPGLRPFRCRKASEVWKAAEQGLWSRRFLDTAWPAARKAEFPPQKRPEDMRSVLGRRRISRRISSGSVLALNDVPKYLVAVEAKRQVARSIPCATSRVRIRITFPCSFTALHR